MLSILSRHPASTRIPRIHIAWIILLAALCPAFAGNKSNKVIPLENYIIKNLTTDEGLPMNQLNYLAASQKGFIWIASFEGLLRFDGHSFKQITHQNYANLKGGAFDIEVDRNGSVWAFDTNYRYLLRYEDGVMSSWETEAYTNVVDYTLFKDWNDDVLFLGEKQFYRIVDDKIIEAPIPGVGDISIHTALFANDGSLWIADQQSGLHHIVNGQSTHYSFEDLDVGSNRIVNLEQGPKQTIWAISSNNDLLRFNGKRWKLFKDDRLAQSGLTRDMLAEANGSVWIGTQNGMFRFNGQKIQKLIQNESYQDEDHIFSITLTIEGSIAYTTFNNGLKLLQKPLFKTYTARHGLHPGAARCIRPLPNGSYLIGSTDGVNCIDTATDKVANLYPELNGVDITDIAIVSPDEIYFASYGQGLYHLKDGNMRRLTQADGLASDTIYRMEFDNEQRLLLGTYAGLDIFDGETFQNLSIKDGLPSNIVLSLLHDSQDTFWLSIASGGLVQYKDGTLTAFTAGTELENVTIFHLLEDASGTLWGGYSGGVLRIHEGKLQTFDLTGIFPRANIFHIWNDEKGHLWLTSNLGLYRVDIEWFEQNQLPENLPYESFLKTEGLPSNNVTALSRAHRAGNTLWLPFSGGVVQVEPEVADTSNYVPDALIHEVTTNSKPIISHAFRSHERWDFKPGLRYLRIKYTAPAFQSSERTSFHTRLKGFEDWTSTSRREATYTNLPPGDYTFEVSVQSVRESDTPTAAAEFQFTIQPYFHQTSFFYILAACAFLLIGYLMNYLRLRATRRQQQKLGELVNARTKELQHRSEELLIAKEHAESANRIKSEFTANISHEIRTPMNSIMGFTDILRNEISEPTHRHYLDTVIKSSETLLTMIDDLLDLSKIEANKLSLNPRACNLTESCRDTLSMFDPKIADKGLELLFKPDSRIPDKLLIDSSRFRQVLLNLVGNAIKFTDQGQICVTLELVQRSPRYAHIRCSVSDTGDGIPKKQFRRIFNAFEQASRDYTRSETGSGLGLAISKRLVEMMNGNISVESAVGKGSTFTVDLPQLKVLGPRDETTEEIVPIKREAATTPKTAFGTDELSQAFLQALFEQIPADKAKQLRKICEDELIPALQVLNLDSLQKAADNIEAIAQGNALSPLYELCQHIRDYSQNLAINKCRRLRSNLITTLEPANS